MKERATVGITQVAEHQSDQEGSVSTDESVLGRMLTEETNPPGGADMHQMEEAMIARWSEKTGTLLDGRLVRMGNSCLVSPSTGDQVLVTSYKGDCWLLAILKRADNNAKLTLSSSTRLDFQAPSITLITEKMNLTAEEFLSRVENRQCVEETHTQTSKLRVSEVETDIRTATTVEDSISGFRLQRMGQWLVNVAREARMTAKSFIFD